MGATGGTTVVPSIAGFRNVALKGSGLCMHELHSVLTVKVESNTRLVAGVMARSMQN